MSIASAIETDNELFFDDWEEDYQSSKGYLLEDDPESNTIISVSIFIKGVLDDETFNKYER